MRSGLCAFFAILAIAAGCSSSATYFATDAGADPEGGSLVGSDGGSTSTKRDAGKKDAAVVEEEDEDAGVVVPKDAGKKDTGSKDAAVPLTCSPGSISGFSPTWIPPKALHSSACTVANATLAVDCTFDPNADPTACQAFNNNSANAACISCVFTDSTESSYGAIVMEGQIGGLNLAGCLAALSGNTTSTGCGAKFQAAQQCQVAACTGCPDPNGGAQALADYQQCEDDSLTSVCTSYETASKCSDPLTQPGASAAACADGATFVLRARNLAKLFCTP